MEHFIHKYYRSINRFRHFSLEMARAASMEIKQLGIAMYAYSPLV